LSSVLEDEELSTFYSRLMVSEANHYTMFLQFARQYGDLKQVNALWQELLAFEAKVLLEFNRPQFIHG
jgi:tRNA-(ms[2]io[6]A)-hydroxylase